MQYNDSISNSNNFIHFKISHNLCTHHSLQFIKCVFFPVLQSRITSKLFFILLTSVVLLLGGLCYYHILSRYLKSKNHYKLHNVFIEILYTTHYSICDKYLYITLICIMYKYVPTQTSNVTFLSSYQYIVLFQFVIHIYLMLLCGILYNTLHSSIHIILYIYIYTG